MAGLNPTKGNSSKAPSLLIFAIRRRNVQKYLTYLFMASGDTRGGVCEVWYPKKHTKPKFNGNKPLWIITPEQKLFELRFI